MYISERNFEYSKKQISSKSKNANKDSLEGTNSSAK